MSPALVLAPTRRPLRRALSVLLFGAGLLGALLILTSSLAYLSPDGAHPFLDERPTLARWPLWRESLRVHVAGGLFCLPVGLLLASRRAALRAPRLHRALGRVYALVFLVTVAPTGILLAFTAKGGLATGLGFALSSVFSAFAFVHAVRLAARRDLRGHQAWMLRSYLQLASAITFRVVHIALQLADVDYDTNYLLSLWLSVLGNAALAELINAAHRRRS